MWMHFILKNPIQNLKLKLNRFNEQKESNNVNICIIITLVCIRAPANCHHRNNTLDS